MVHTAHLVCEVVRPSKELMGAIFRDLDSEPSLVSLSQDRLKDLNSQADSLMTSSAFDTSQVKEKRDTINGRFQKIKSMATSRRAKLSESHRLHQFFRDMDDEESWIKCVPCTYISIVSRGGGDREV